MSTSGIRGTTKESDIPSLQLIAALDPVVATLDAFNHRHRNQHRVARWWSQFDLFRRSVRRLSEAVHLHAKKVTSDASSRAKKKRSANSSKSQAVNPANPADRTLESANFLNDHVLPKSYIAFTQLSADQQHAPLGLLLVGLLARIRAEVLGNLLPESSLMTPGDDTSPERASSELPEAAGFASEAEVSTPVEHSAADDLGVAISRDNLTESPAPPQKTKRPAKLARKLPRTESVSAQPPAKPASSPDEATAATITGSSKPAKKRKDEKPTTTQKKKKKKPAGGGGEDDFSNLFGSLL